MSMMSCPSCSKLVDTDYHPESCPKCDKPLFKKRRRPPKKKDGDKAASWVAANCRFATSIPRRFANETLKGDRWKVGYSVDYKLWCLMRMTVDGSWKVFKSFSTKQEALQEARFQGARDVKQEIGLEMDAEHQKIEEFLSSASSEELDAFRGLEKNEKQTGY
jgi:hypothetical protein